MRPRFVVLFSVLVLPAFAAPPATSPLPEPRPSAAREVAIERAVTAAILGVRSPDLGQGQGPRRSAAVSIRRVTATTPRLSPRPELRPENLRRRAQVVRSGMVSVMSKPSGKMTLLCQSADIVGQRVADIPGRIRGCGVKDPVRVRSVAGVALSQPAVMDCRTAMALRFWVESALKPAVGNREGGVRQLKVAAHYACRTRNNRKGGKISEHGKGRAIDISGFTLGSGRVVSVLHGWNSGDGQLLRRIHRAACGPFGTVLGPNADRFHRDHFHFDTARYRSGTYCR